MCWPFLKQSGLSRELTTGMLYLRQTSICMLLTLFTMRLLMSRYFFHWSITSSKVSSLRLWGGNTTLPVRLSTPLVSTSSSTLGRAVKCMPVPQVGEAPPGIMVTLPL